MNDDTRTKAAANAADRIKVAINRLHERACYVLDGLPYIDPDDKDVVDATSGTADALIAYAAREASAELQAAISQYLNEQEL